MVQQSGLPTDDGDLHALAAVAFGVQLIDALWAITETSAWHP